MGKLFKCLPSNNIWFPDPVTRYCVGFFKLCVFSFVVLAFCFGIFCAGSEKSSGRINWPISKPVPHEYPYHIFSPFLHSGVNMISFDFFLGRHVGSLFFIRCPRTWTGFFIHSATASQTDRQAMATDPFVIFKFVVCSPPLPFYILCFSAIC